ncbi:MAG: hypothetical protein HY841_10545 [Bacteroidetes bacterium]|nr:hypothetical protein [Bacteroidota bacterium]
MRKLFTIYLLLPLFAFTQQVKTEHSPYALKDFSVYFNGSWENDTAKSEGMGQGTRQYELILNNAHLQVSNKANNLSQDKKTMVCYHQDIGVFSYDKSRKKIIYREFTSEKFFSQYVCDSISPDKKTFIFHSESFENVPAGYKGRITITILEENIFIEHFELAEAGKSFQTYVKGMWVRKK